MDTTSLESELDWREAELASLKILALSFKNDTARRNALLRSMWCLLYAHYEGFFKFTWDFYLDEITRRGELRKHFREPLQMLSLSKQFTRLRKDLSEPALWKCFRIDFQGWLDESISFELKLDTDSNLWPNLARENSEKACLPTAEISGNFQKIRALVSRRNDIAHGQRMVIESIEEYEKYEAAARMVMHEVALGVIDALENRLYLEPAVSPADQGFTH